MPNFTITDVEDYIRNRTGIWDFYEQVNKKLILESNDIFSEDFQLLSEMQLVLWNRVREKLEDEYKVRERING